MAIELQPQDICFLYDSQMIEFAADQDVYDTENYSGYIKVRQGLGTPVYQCELMPHFSHFNNRYTVDVSDLAEMDIQPPPDSALTQAGVSAGLLVGAYDKLHLDIGERYGNPPENYISTSIVIKQIYGESPFWNGFPQSGNVLLHAMFTLDRATNNRIVKEVLPTTPEFICVFSPAGGSINLVITVTTKSGATSTINKTASLSEGCNYITASPTQLGVTGVANARYYEVEILGQVLSYVLIAGEPKDQRYLIYDNGIGGIETLKIGGLQQHESRARSNRLFKKKWIGDNQRQGLLLESRKTGADTIRCNTGYITYEHAIHLKQLQYGKIWLIDPIRNTFIRYYLDQDSISLPSTGEDVYNVEFTITRGHTSAVSNNFGA